MDRFFSIGKLTGSEILTSLMSLYAFILAVIFKDTHRWVCFAAMFLSSIGDIILNRYTWLSKKLGKKAFPVGGTFFASAHFVYAATYYLQIKSHGFNVFNSGYFTALVISVAAGVSLVIMGKNKKNNALMYAGGLVYLCLITCASSMIFSFSFSMGGVYLIAAVGSLSFFISDYIIGINKFGNIKKFDWLVWWFYPIGQILIITFG